MKTTTNRTHRTNDTFAQSASLSAPQQVDSTAAPSQEGSLSAPRPRPLRRALATAALVGPLALALLLGGPLGESTSHAAPAKSAKQPAGEGGLQGVVNINTANADQLTQLPGIGPAKASRIVKYRTRRQFKHTYEIIRVRGIGRRTYRRLRRHLTVKGSTTLTGGKSKRKRRSKKAKG